MVETQCLNRKPLVSDIFCIFRPLLKLYQQCVIILCQDLDGLLTGIAHISQRDFLQRPALRVQRIPFDQILSQWSHYRKKDFTFQHLLQVDYPIVRHQRPLRGQFPPKKRLLYKAYTSGISCPASRKVPGNAGYLLPCVRSHWSLHLPYKQGKANDIMQRIDAAARPICVLICFVIPLPPAIEATRSSPVPADFRAMNSRNLFTDCQAQAVAPACPRSTFVYPIKWFHNPLAFLRRNARPSICRPQPNPFVRHQT